MTARWELPLAARLLLAAVLGYAGAIKLGDLAEAGRTFALYQIGPADLAQTVGGAMPLLEVAVALLLALGLATRVVAGFTALLMIAYIAAIVSVWARGISIDCGCFGGGGAVTSGAQRGYVIDIARDLALLAVAGLLVRHPGQRYSLDGWILPPKERSA